MSKDRKFLQHCMEDYTNFNEKYAPIKVSENDRLDIFGKVLGKSDASAITGHYR